LTFTALIQPDQAQQYRRWRHAAIAMLDRLVRIYQVEV